MSTEHGSTDAADRVWTNTIPTPRSTEPTPSSMMSDQELAWLLVEAAGPGLDAEQISLVFVDIGAGDPFAAIERILSIVVGNGMPIPHDLRHEVSKWLRRYVGFADGRRLQRLFDTANAPGQRAPQHHLRPVRENEAPL